MIEELHLIPYWMRMAVIGRHIELYIIRYIFINTVLFNFSALIEFIMKTRYDEFNLKNYSMLRLSLLRLFPLPHLRHLQ